MKTGDRVIVKAAAFKKSPFSELAPLIDKSNYPFKSRLFDAYNSSLDRFYVKFQKKLGDDRFVALSHFDYKKK